MNLSQDTGFSVVKHWPPNVSSNCTMLDLSWTKGWIFFERVFLTPQPSSLIYFLGLTMSDGAHWEVAKGTKKFAAMMQYWPGGVVGNPTCAWISVRYRVIGMKCVHCSMTMYYK
jgi:hypothetical protein